MKRKTANIDVRVEPELVERIDAWRTQQRVQPSRSAAIVYMLEHFLEDDPKNQKAAGRGS
jgi:metal-responsive CopG/Arc/MetJ family transcriptional regulator